MQSHGTRKKIDPKSTSAFRFRWFIIELSLNQQYNKHRRINTAVDIVHCTRQGGLARGPHMHTTQPVSFGPAGRTRPENPNCALIYEMIQWSRLQGSGRLYSAEAEAGERYWPVIAQSLVRSFSGNSSPQLRLFLVHFQSTLNPSNHYAYYHCQPIQFKQ